MKKRIFNLSTILFLVLSFCGCNNEVIIPQNKAQDIVYNMQFGWNLGNTLDATHWQDTLDAGNSTETTWGQPKTTKEMIVGLKNLGIKTIRIPISWHNHIIDTNYTINPEWMSRVKEIVDWAYEEDMYIIINIHHDNADSEQNFQYGKGFYPSIQCKDESIRFLTRIWEQVSNTFNNDYDEKLIFEVLNEPRLVKNEHEWSYNSSCKTCKNAMDVLTEFNQKCLDTIRESGGKNATRLVMIPSIAASVDNALHPDFKLPIDSAKNALAVSVHMYTPYNFAMASPGNTNFTSDDKSVLSSYFYKLYKKFVSKGIPVIIGEMGATNKNNLKERENWFEYFVGTSRKYGMSSCVWDNGNWEVKGSDYSEKYGYYNRNTQEWYFPTLMKIAINASSIE